MSSERDRDYLKIIFDRLEVCKLYQPKFGRGRAGISYQEFLDIYSKDLFYVWFGLDNRLIYSAHKTAGGITSVYRQIGLVSEELVRRILQDELELTVDQATWSYQVESASGQTRKLKLDARISLADIRNYIGRDRVDRWMRSASAALSLSPGVASAMRGVVFEIRQGYKSKDSKRQNADMANAAAAYTQGYLPVLAVLSSQIDNDIMERYERGKWLVLRGNLIDDPLSSTFAFVDHVVGYDLAGFFERNAPLIRQFTREVLESLLKADGDG